MGEIKNKESISKKLFFRILLLTQNLGRFFVPQPPRYTDFIPSPPYRYRYLFIRFNAHDVIILYRYNIYYTYIL